MKFSPPVVDIKHTRNLAYGSTRKDLQKAVDRLRTRVETTRELAGKGDSLEDHGYYESCADRLVAGLLLSGLRPAKTKEGSVDFAADPIQVEYPSHAKGQPPAVGPMDVEAADGASAAAGAGGVDADVGGGDEQAGKDKDNSGEVGAGGADASGSGGASGAKGATGGTGVTVSAPQAAIAPAAEAAAASSLLQLGTKNAQAHTTELRQLLSSMPLLPVEQPEAILSLTELNTTCSRIKPAVGVASIGQLFNSLGTAAADLSRENKRQTDRVEKESRDQLERQALEKKRLRCICEGDSGVACHRGRLDG